MVIPLSKTPGINNIIITHCQTTRLAGSAEAIGSQGKLTASDSCLDDLIHCGSIDNNLSISLYIYRNTGGHKFNKKTHKKVTVELFFDLCRHFVFPCLWSN